MLSLKIPEHETKVGDVMALAYVTCSDYYDPTRAQFHLRW